MAVHMLTEEETMLVETVRAFVDREVKPTVREVEHANEYPEAWIEQMKRIGIYGLAIPEAYGGSPVSTPCYVAVTQELSRGWMSLAGAMGGHTVVAKLLALFGTEEQKQQYLPLMATGEVRATMALTEPGGGSDLQNMTTTAPTDGAESGDQRVQDVDQQRPQVGSDRAAVQDRSVRPRLHTKGISVVLVEHGEAARGSDGVAGSAQAGLQGRRVLRADVRRLPRARDGDPRRRARQGLRPDDEGP